MTRDDVRHDGEDQGQHREHEPLRVRPRRLARPDARGGRQQVPDVGGEQDDQQRARRRTRAATRGRGSRRRSRVERLVPPGGGVGADGDRDRDRQRRRHGHEEQRVPDAVAEHFRHRQAVGERHARVAGEQPAQPVPVLRISGSSRPSSCCLAATDSGVASRPRMARAGSSSAWVRTNTTTDTMNSVRTPKSSRRDDELDDAHRRSPRAGSRRGARRRVHLRPAARCSCSRVRSGRG